MAGWDGDGDEDYMGEYGDDALAAYYGVPEGDDTDDGYDSNGQLMKDWADD